MGCTRLAPSPTGALHLGNARTLLLTHAYARSRGLGLILRIEDLESPRKKPWARAELLDDLRWLGIDWDGDPVDQSARRPLHLAALDRLSARSLVYACTCSRADVEEAQDAPDPSRELFYGGRCRDRYGSFEEAYAAAGRPVALRMRAPDGIAAFRDLLRGPMEAAVSAGAGDFVLARWTPEGGPVVGYQLAVVVDDADQGVDLVIRGEDLLPSTARQRWLQSLLGLPEPEYIHAAMVAGPDGRRLAKRHGDTRLRAYREAGVPASRIRAWIARSAGLSAGFFEKPFESPLGEAAFGTGTILLVAHPVEAGPPAGEPDRARPTEPGQTRGFPGQTRGSAPT